MPFLSTLQRLLGYAEDSEDEAQPGTTPADQEAPASVEPPLADPRLAEPPVPETCAPPLPEEPETPYWEDDRELECPLPPWRLPQKMPSAPSAPFAASAPSAPFAAPSPSTPVELFSAAAEARPAAWQPPEEFDLRECDKCKCWSYLRKQACVNSKCASYLHLVDAQSIFFGF